MNNQILSIIYAFLGSSLVNLAQAIQKIGLDSPDEKKLRKWEIWGSGTVLMMIGPLVIQYATSLGGASLVGAMSGTGLATLTLFSHFVMKEKIKSNELTGVITILLASLLIGIFSTGKNIKSTINLTTLLIFISIVTTGYIICTSISIKIGKLIGIILGGFSGATGGFVTLFQKVTTSNPTGATNIFLNPFFYTWIIISLVSFFILQFSYKKDKAIRIVPSFSANYILIPVLGGVICYSEIMNLFQWIGVLLILAGVLLITIKIKNRIKEN